MVRSEGGRGNRGEVFGGGGGRSGEEVRRVLFGGGGHIERGYSADR